MYMVIGMYGMYGDIQGCIGMQIVVMHQSTINRQSQVLTWLQEQPLSEIQWHTSTRNRFSSDFLSALYRESKGKCPQWFMGGFNYENDKIYIRNSHRYKCNKEKKKEQQQLLLSNLRVSRSEATELSVSKEFIRSGQLKKCMLQFSDGMLFHFIKYVGVYKHKEIHSFAEWVVHLFEVNLFQGYLQQKPVPLTLHDYVATQESFVREKIPRIATTLIPNKEERDFVIKQCLTRLAQHPHIDQFVCQYEWHQRHPLTKTPSLPNQVLTLINKTHQPLTPIHKHQLITQISKVDQVLTKLCLHLQNKYTTHLIELQQKEIQLKHSLKKKKTRNNRQLCTPQKQHNIHQNSIPQHNIHQNSIPQHNIHQNSIPQHNIHQNSIPQHNIHQNSTPQHNNHQKKQNNNSQGQQQNTPQQQQNSIHFVSITNDVSLQSTLSKSLINSNSIYIQEQNVVRQQNLSLQQGQQQVNNKHIQQVYNKQVSHAIIKGKNINKKLNNLSQNRPITINIEQSKGKRALQNKKKQQLQKSKFKNMNNEMQKSSLQKQSKYIVQAYSQEMQIYRLLDQNIELYISKLQQKSSKFQKYRQAAYKLIQSAIKELNIDQQWQLRMFGSCASNFSLRQSDVDLVLLMTDPSPMFLQTLFGLLNMKPYIHNINIYSGARVPIIALSLYPIPKQKQLLKLDISVAHTSSPHEGICNTIYMQELFQKDRLLRGTCLILKELLRVSHLNRPYTGGIGSFILVVMVHCILSGVRFKSKYYQQIVHVSEYMRKFKPRQTVIAIHDKGEVPPNHYLELNVQDPRNHRLLVTSAYRIASVVHVFHLFRNMLENAQDTFLAVGCQQTKKLRKIFAESIKTFMEDIGNRYQEQNYHSDQS